MIYLFYGENTDKARAKWRKVMASFEAKYPEGAIFRFDAEHWDQAQFAELLNSIDLFGGKRLVVADRLLENKEALAFVEENTKAINDAATVFAFLEVKTPKELLKKIEKVAGKVDESVGGSSDEASGEFNIFALTEALGNRDRKLLWTLLQEALFAGVAAEEVFWKLVWQTKMMLLVIKAKGTPLKTVKPFVASKAARFAKNYSQVELEQLSGELVSLWHESKRENGPDFEVGLERLVLSL